MPGTDQNNYNILVIIPCLNEEDHIENVVENLFHDQKIPSMRVVIADGGSTDRTVEIIKKLTAKYPDLFYFHNPKRIQSAAINLAVENFGNEAKYLIRIDAHSEYPADFIKILIEEAELTQASSVVIAMKTIGKDGFQDAVAAAQNSKLGNGGSAHRLIADEGCYVDHGHHALMKIRDFRAVNGYDESFSHNEDAELDTRLTQAGFKIWLTAKTFINYYPRSSPVRLFRQYFNFGRGRARNILKHKTRMKLRQLLPVAVLPALVLLILSPLWWILALPAMMWAGLCIIYGILLGLKSKEHVIMLSGVAAIIMHAGWSLGFWNEILKNKKQRPK